MLRRQGRSQRIESDLEFESQDYDSGYQAQDNLDIYKYQRSQSKGNKYSKQRNQGYLKSKTHHIRDQKLRETREEDDEFIELTNSQGNITNQQLLNSNESDPEFSYLPDQKHETLGKKIKKSKTMGIDSGKDSKGRLSKNRSIRDAKSNMLQYIEDPYGGELKSLQINMLICQSIALNDEQQFLKSLKSMTQILKSNPTESIALRAVSLFAGKEFAEVKWLGPLKQMREAMNDALWFAIELGRESIGFDLIEFAKKNVITLSIHEKQLQLLINGEMYELIEDLIRTNVFLFIDVSKISGADLFEISKIQDRKLSNAKEQEEVDKLQKLAEQNNSDSIDQSLKKNSSLRKGEQPDQKDQKSQESDYFEGGSSVSPRRGQVQRQATRNNQQHQSPARQEQRALQSNSNLKLPQNKNTPGEKNQNLDQLFEDQSVKKGKAKQKDDQLNLDQVMQELNLDERPGQVKGSKKDLPSPYSPAPDTVRPKDQQLSEVPEIPNTAHFDGDNSAAKLAASSKGGEDQLNPEAKNAINQLMEQKETQLVEKYLKISDFIEYIMEKRDIFVGELFKKVKNKEEEDFIFMTFLENFMLNVQDVIDYDRTVKILIENNLQKMLIDELFEQTDASLKSNEIEKDLTHQQEFKSARFKEIPENLEQIFRKFGRIRLLVQLINQSVLLNKYHIAYEITKRFLGDLLKTSYLPIFDPIFSHFEEYTTFYEAKIALLYNMMPLMNRKLAGRIMKILESILNEPASNSVLKNNINPLRVGLMLYRLIDEIQQNFGYSEHTSTLMKDMLSDQLRNVLEMYNDPDELMVLVEQTDYEGNDSFWYLDEFDLYNILDSRIMDRVIQKKFTGKYETNVTIDDYSTGYTLMADKYQLYATDRVFSELRVHVLNFDRATWVHGYKFHVWKHSMQLRSRIDFAFNLVLSVSFQLFLNEFQTQYNTAKTLTFDPKNSPELLALDPKKLEQVHKAQLLAIDGASNYLFLIQMVTIFHLLFPLNQLMIWFFVRQTKRKYPEPDSALLTELVLFIVTAILYNQFSVYGSKVDHNKYARDDFTASQHRVMNFLYFQHTNTYEINIILSILAMSTWFKLLIRLMVTHTFGPFFKVIGMMLIDLAKFMVLFVLFLLVFASGASVIFSRIDTFPGFYQAILLYFEVSLGSWDNSIYCNDPTVPMYFCTIGKFFSVIVLLVNLVLLLNLVIAILSSTYAYYEDKKLGLYYEVLVAKFPTMEYDDNYGVVACAQPPLNLMILPFWWITLLPWSEDLLKKYLYDFNQFLCHLLYFPLAIILTCFFILICLFYAPIAYVKHTIVLIETLTDSDETMDEFHEKLERFFTILKFAFFGPFILLSTVPIDAVNFFKNLYTKPYVEKYDSSSESISLETLEVFELSCKEQLKVQRANPNHDKTSTLVPFVELNRRLQIKLDIENHIFRLLFDNSDGQKFYFDENSKTQKLSPIYLKGLKEFILLKKLVANSADKTAMVDINLLLSLTQQVNLRNKMLEIEINAGDLELGSSEEIQSLNLYEFTKVEPATVESMLSEEGQVLDIVVEKVNSLHDDISALSETQKENMQVMNDRFDQLQEQIAQIMTILQGGGQAAPARRPAGSEGHQTHLTAASTSQPNQNQ